MKAPNNLGGSGFKIKKN